MRSGFDSPAAHAFVENRVRSRGRFRMELVASVTLAFVFFPFELLLPKMKVHIEDTEDVEGL